MHTKVKNKCLAVVSLLFVIFCVGCSPVYRTEYQYIPPENQSDRACLNTCLSIQQSCISDKNREYQECRSRAASDYANCMAMRNFSYSIGPRGEYYDRRCVSNCYCQRDFCDGPDYAGCEELYAECYRNCGGEAIPAQVCVRFCK